MQTRLTSDTLKKDTCVRGHTLSLLLAIQPGCRLAGLLPKGGTLPPGRCFRRPVATLLRCKPRQSKRLLSIHFVQSRNCDNLLSSLLISSTKERVISPTFSVRKMPFEVPHDCGTALFNVGMYFLDLFLIKWRSPLDPVSSNTLIVFV